MATYFLKTDDAKIVTLDFPSTGARKSSEIIVNFPGVSTEDFISLDAKFPVNASFQAWVSGTDQVTVRFHNYTNSSVNLSPFQIRLLVLKKEIVSIGTTQTVSTDITVKPITGSKTLDLTDISKLLNVSGVSVITIPTDTVVNFPIGSLIYFNRIGTGEVSFLTQAGVTLNSFSGFRKLNGQFSQAYLIKLAANNWQLVGNIKN